MSFESIKKIKLEDMMKYIEEKAPQDKEWFKSVALKDKINKEAEEVKVYSHLSATKAFCQRYKEFNHLIVEAKPKEPKKSAGLENW